MMRRSELPALLAQLEHRRPVFRMAPASDEPPVEVTRIKRRGVRVAAPITDDKPRGEHARFSRPRAAEAIAAAAKGHK